MSNDKVQAEIVKSLESEANYKKIVPNILKEVVASNRSYIFNLIQLSSAILSNPKYDSSTKYWSLLLIKDVMQLNQNLFATSLIESQIMATLEAICLKNPKTDKETELLFGPEANPKYSKRFYILMIECIKIWGQRYQDAKAPLGKYYTIYNGLIQKGVEFPTVYYFFQNKPEPQDASKPAGKGVPEQNVNKKPGESSTKPMGEFGKTAEMQKQQQQQQQQIAGNFSFKAQSPVAEDHKQEEEEYYDEDLPIMYNAGELEIDESEQTEYEEEGDSMEDFKVVQKKPELEKPRPQLQIQTQSQPQPQPKQQLQPQPLVQPQTQPQSKQQSQQQSPLQPQSQPQLQSQQQSKPQPQPEPVKKEEKEKEPEKKKGGILQALGFGKKSSSEDLKKGDTPKKVDSKNEVKTPVDSGRKKETEPKANIVEQKPETLPAKNVVNRVIESPVEKKAVQNVEAGPVTKPQGVVYQQPKEVKNVNFIVQQEVINEGSPALNKSVDKGQGKVVVQQEVIKEGKQSPLNKSVEQVQGKVSRPGTPVEVKKNRSEEEKEKDKIPEKMGKIDINIQLDMKAIEKLGKADQVGNSGSAKTVEGILQKAAEPMSGKDVKPPLDPQVLQKKKSDSFVEWEEVVETNPNKQSSSRRNSRNSVSKDVREEQQGPSSSQFKPKAQDISNEKITLESFSEDKEVINYTLTQSGQSGKASKEPQRDQNLASIRKKSEGYYYNSKDSSSQNAPTDPRAQRRNSENVPNKDVPVKAGSVQGLAFGIYPKFANTQQGVVNNKVVVNESPTQVQESKNIQQLNKNIEKAPVNTPASSNKPERDQPSLQVEKKKSSDKGQANNTLVLPNSAASSAQKELDMSNVQKEEHNRGRGHSQGPSGSDFVRKRSASTRAEPDAPNKNVSDLQQKYDALSGENMKIKAQLEKMSRQLKEETQKSNMLQERLSTTQYDRREQVNTSYQEDRRSLSPSKKLTLKTEIPAGLSNTFNNTLNGTRTTYSSGFRSYEGSAQKPVRGRSPKVETIKDSTLTATYGSFLHKKYALFNDSYPLATEPGINTVDNFMNNPRRKNEFNPLMTTMLKTEFFQSTWGQEPLWMTQDYINRSAISHSDDLVFSTTFDKVRLSCLKNQEILFESQELKVESSTFYTRSVTGRLSIVLIFTNKAESTLTEFNVTYSRSTRGFMVTPEQSYFETKLTPGKSEFHTLNAELIGHPTEIGVMVVEFRLNDELHRFKMNFPLIITKFMRFIPVSVSDYVRGRKSLLLRYPSNIDESQPIQVSDEYMNILQESFLAKLINVPVEDDKVTMYVACFSLGGYSSEYYLRIIVEKEKQSVIIQIVYPGEGMQDAKNLLNKLVFLFDEKSTL